MDAKSINTNLQRDYVRRWYMFPVMETKIVLSISSDAIVFGVLSFDAFVFDSQWNCLMSFHSLSELSGLMPAKDSMGISKS